MKNFLDDHPQDWENNPEYEELRTLLVYMADSSGGTEFLRDLAYESGISAGSFLERENVGATCRALIKAMGLQGKLRKLVEVASIRPTVHTARLRQMLTLPARQALDVSRVAEVQQAPTRPAEAPPRQPPRTKTWDQGLTELRDLLADLYPREQEARQVVEQAGLPTGRISFSAAGRSNWHSILREAVRRHMVPAIVDVACLDYPEQATELSQALSEHLGGAG